MFFTEKGEVLENKDPGYVEHPPGCGGGGGRQNGYPKHPAPEAIRVG